MIMSITVYYLFYYHYYFTENLCLVVNKYINKYVFNL